MAVERHSSKRTGMAARWGLAKISEDATNLVSGGGPATALFRFFAQVVERTAASRRQ
jgi:hypothetical protein